MISSEVQRTLVKSPPELWTELSDPDALARHLGELGEIRITRTEPERLVEWEAQGTTGTVAIKSSGWGTKVTLTVHRELPPRTADEPGPPEQAGATAAATLQGEDQSAPPAALQCDADAIVAAALEREADPPPGHESDAAAIRSDAVESDADTTELSRAPHAAASADAAPAPGPADQPARRDRTPAPATEAARRAAGWPATYADGVPAIESDLRAAEAPAAASPTPLAETAAVAIEQLLETPPDASAEDEAETLPRRGLFARLFRRRRARGPHLAMPEPTMEDPEPGPEPEPEPEPDQEPGQEPGRVVADALAVDREPSGEDPMAIAPAHDASPPEPSLGEGIDTPGVFSCAEPPVSEPGSPEPGAPAANAPATSEANAPEGTGVDLAAELQAAEEIAAEEVKAVLTSVLDRLGAAHHRPFSRS